jgi:addiction module RelE/StbE family toxin
MEKERFEVGPLARKDLDDIWQYIALDNADTATDFCGRLINEARSLLHFPYRGQPLRNRPGKRKLIFRSYLIIYHVNETENSIEIHRFWHGAQNPRGLRLKEEAAGYGQAPLSALA